MVFQRGSGTYNAFKAVEYADKYALSPNRTQYIVFSSDCTNFVSQALYAGGWPFANTGLDVTSQYAWYYDNKGTTSTSDDVYSHTWSVAKNLYTFIVLDSNPSRGKNATASPYLGTTLDPYPDNTTIGDVIFYDWEGDGTINHASIYVANGADSESGYSGALVDQHTTNRYHAIWSLSYYNTDRDTTKIYPVHLYSSF